MSYARNKKAKERRKNRIDSLNREKIEERRKKKRNKRKATV